MDVIKHDYQNYLMNKYRLHSTHMDILNSFTLIMLFIVFFCALSVLFLKCINCELYIINILFHSVSLNVLQFEMFNYKYMINIQFILNTSLKCDLHLKRILCWIKPLYFSLILSADYLF